MVILGIFRGGGAKCSMAAGKGVENMTEGIAALLTNFRIKFVEGDTAGAMWALGAIQILALLASLFELFLSGFRNFTLQKRILVFTALLLAGYYIVCVTYVLLMKNDAMFYLKPAISFPLISLILDAMTFMAVQKTEAAIIAGAGSFRLRD